jgi:hypothetical protein
MSGRAHLFLLAVTAAACATAPPLILAGASGAPRVAATLGVLALAPGAVIAGALRRPALELGLVLGTSLGCCTVGAEAMLSLGTWAPRAATCAVALVCLPFVTSRIYRLFTSGPHGSSEIQP